MFDTSLERSCHLIMAALCAARYSLRRFAPQVRPLNSVACGAGSYRSNYWHCRSQHCWRHSNRCYKLLPGRSKLAYRVAHPTTKDQSAPINRMLVITRADWAPTPMLLILYALCYLFVGGRSACSDFGCRRRRRYNSVLPVTTGSRRYRHRPGK